MRNASKDLTVVFMQDLGVYTADMFILDWATSTLTHKEFNFGPSTIWILTSARIYPSVTGDHSVFFAGFTTSMWGVSNCEATTNQFYNFIHGEHPFMNGFGFINVMGPNLRSCVRSLCIVHPDILISQPNFITTDDPFTCKWNECGIE